MSQWRAEPCAGCHGLCRSDGAVKLRFHNYLRDTRAIFLAPTPDLFHDFFGNVIKCTLEQKQTRFWHSKRGAMCVWLSAASLDMRIKSWMQAPGRTALAKSWLRVGEGTGDTHRVPWEGIQTGSHRVAPMPVVAPRTPSMGPCGD